MLKQKLTFAVAALVLGSSAWADSFQTETSSTAVSYQRSELSSDQGAAAVYSRLDTAARAVCGARTSVLSQLVAWQNCRDAALDRAVADINDQRLSALHKMAPRRLVASTAGAGSNSGS
jgi:UrcA family protein